MALIARAVLQQLSLRLQVGYLRNHILGRRRFGFDKNSSHGTDTYLTTVQKLIPGEAAAVYPIGLALLDGSPAIANYVYVWSWAVLIATALLRFEQTKEKGENPQWVAMTISLISFVLFVFSLGRSFFPWSLSQEYRPIISLMVIFWSMVGPALYRLALKHKST